MKVFIIIFFIFLIINPALANIQDYINSYNEYFNSESYKSFSDTVKGQASISDIEKRLILDKEIAKELNSTFIYTDLEECIKIALDKNYDIKIFNEQKSEAFWSYKNAQFQLLPNLYYNFDIKNLGGKYLVGGIVATNAHEVPIQSQFGIEWSTINQGKYFFLTSQAKHLFQSSVFNYEFEKEQIVLNTVLAYYDLLSMKQQIEVQKNNLYERVEQLKYTNARFEAGIGTLYDVKRAQAEVAGAEQEYTETLNSLRLSQAHLANILGIDILDAVYPFEINVDVRKIVDSNESIENLYEQALVSREDIKSLQEEIQAARAQRSSNFTDIIPAVTVAYQKGLVGTKRLGLSKNNSLTLDINAQLGENMMLGTITQLKTDNAILKQKKLQLTNLKRQVKENILNSYYDSENSLKKIEASKIEVEAADVSLDLSIANMKAGDATFIDVISSQNLKVHANINLIKNMIEYNKAQAQLLFDIGILSPKNVLIDYKKRFH